jgi:hypothetical protein
MAEYTYIKKNFNGYYVEFDEMLDPNLYDNIGESYEDFLDNKWVLLAVDQVAFHKEHPEASVEEVWNMQIAPEPPRTLEQAKNEMINNINDYDASDNVNAFNIHDTEHDVTFEGWFTPEERSNYKSSIDAAKLIGVSALTFFIGDVELEVTPTQAEYMLAQIQLYADQCYIVTKQHKIDVSGLDTIAAVDAYPYQQGYPNKIIFEYPFQGVE